MRLSLTILTTTTALSAFTSALSLWGGGGGSSSSNSNTRSDNPLSLQERASIWGLPDCASTCVTSSFGGCKSIDVECICKNTEFLSSLGCCMSKACDEADQQAAIGFANNFCSAYKVSNLPTAATCASTSSPATATFSTTAAASTLDPSSPTLLLPALNSAAAAAMAGLNGTTNATNGTIGYVSTRSFTVTATVTASSTGGAVMGRGGAQVTGWVWGGSVGAVIVGAAAAVL